MREGLVPNINTSNFELNFEFWKNKLSCCCCCWTWAKHHFISNNLCQLKYFLAKLHSVSFYFHFTCLSIDLFLSWNFVKIYDGKLPPYILQSTVLTSKWTGTFFLKEITLRVTDSNESQKANQQTTGTWKKNDKNNPGRSIFPIFMFIVCHFLQL